jgi:alkylation response protein AidB-like acyl-CoA dehydrogenase
MDFEYTESQRSFRNELRDWLEETMAQDWVQEGMELPDGKPEREAFLRRWQRTLYEGGWAGIDWPEEYGGRGASLVEQTIYQQEMARANAPPSINELGLDFVGPTIIELGTDAQKQRFLPNILSGEEIWCQGYSEPGAGSDVASLTTQAQRQGDEFVINGEKVWTSHAHHSDWCLAVTRTDESGTKHEGLTTLLVDMHQEGVTTKPIHQANDRSAFNRVYFDDAVASADQVLGTVGGGWTVVRTLSSFEHAETRIFKIERRFKDLLEWCRTQTRNGEPLAQQPEIRQELADLSSRIRAAKLTHLRNVTEWAETGKPGPEGSMEHVVGDELKSDLENFALNLLGPQAALWEDGPDSGESVGRYLMSYGFWIGGGTGDIHRNIVAEQGLGLPSDIKSETSHRRES